MYDDCVVHRSEPGEDCYNIMKQTHHVQMPLGRKQLLCEFCFGARLAIYSHSVCTLRDLLREQLRLRLCDLI